MNTFKNITIFKNPITIKLTNLLMIKGKKNKALNIILNTLQDLNLRKKTEKEKLVIKEKLAIKEKLVIKKKLAIKKKSVVKNKKVIKKLPTANLFLEEKVKRLTGKKNSRALQKRDSTRWSRPHWSGVKPWARPHQGWCQPAGLARRCSGQTPVAKATARNFNPLKIFSKKIPKKTTEISSKKSINLRPHQGWCQPAGLARIDRINFKVQHLSILKKRKLELYKTLEIKKKVNYKTHLLIRKINLNCLEKKNNTSFNYEVKQVKRNVLFNKKNNTFEVIDKKITLASGVSEKKNIAINPTTSVVLTCPLRSRTYEKHFTVPVGKKILKQKNLVLPVEEQPEETVSSILNEAINAIKPTFYLRKVRARRKSYQVPCILTPQRQTTLALNWIIEGAQLKKKKTPTKLFYKCLSEEILDCLEQDSYGKKNEICCTEL